MKLLLIILILVMSVFTVEGIEHARLSRGITCELFYIQGQVDNAKSLDYLANRMKTPLAKDFMLKVKKYQMTVASSTGTSTCATIEHSFVEVAYIRTKYFLFKK